MALLFPHVAVPARRKAKPPPSQHSVMVNLVERVLDQLRNT